ncbi:MAG: class II aldolase/adducin family protein [Chloroflexi bacterium]|nr:class II aldolase/adducin family protein [Chloroflexota bacterium]MBI1854445.1 class II aldolase/adducin family protein [Chloroflexota bacterium]MBI3341098.1 class II aldolase/adducin family protein [Chloroflexota bacterium]
MSPFDPSKKQVVEVAQELVRKGYLMATGGNLSLRIAGQDAFAITPSNYDYMKMTPNDVCILGFDLALLEGHLKPSVESAMHGAIYQVRRDVNAIVHTHQVYASALTLIKAPIPALFDEQARFLGRSVEIIPYAPSGTGFLKSAVAKHVRNHNNAFMMQNHGALVFGHNMERAIHNVEILEKCSLAYLLAICSERNVSKIPLAVREIAFSKLRNDQKKIAKGGSVTSGE